MPFEVLSENLYLPYHSEEFPLKRERTAPKSGRVTRAIGMHLYQSTTHLVFALVRVVGVRKVRVWESVDRWFDQRCLEQFKRANLLTVEGGHSAGCNFRSSWLSCATSCEKLGTKRLYTFLM